MSQAIEAGFVDLVNTALATSLPSASGGFALTTPENFVSKSNPMSWTFRSILSRPLYTLAGQNDLTGWVVQIDCLGFSMFHAISIANAITAALSGGCSHLTLSDGTRVEGIFAEATQVDGFQPDSRYFVRSLEYQVVYHHQ